MSSFLILHYKLTDNIVIGLKDQHNMVNVINILEEMTL